MKQKVKPVRKKSSPKSHGGGGDPASRERILAAAVALFARHGFAATGMRELAAEAGVNLAMINYFFGSKKGLLKEILDGFFSGYLGVAREQLQREGEAAEKLRGFITAAVEYFDTQRDALIVAITELPHDDPDVIEHKAVWGRQMIALLDEQICRPLAEQCQRPLSPQVFGPMLTSMMASRFLFAPITPRVGDDGSLSIDDYATALADLVLCGLTPPPDRQQAEP